jgi:flagellar motor protein MotB
VDGLAVEGWSEGTEVSLVELFTVELPAGDAAEEAPAGDGPGWTAELKTIEVRDNSLRWRSEFTDPALLEVSPIEARVQAVKWPLAGDSPVELSLTINGQTTVSVNGSLALAEGQGSLNYDLQALPLTWFNPNFPAALRVKLTDGQLGVKGEVGLAEWSPKMIRANGAIEGFNGLMEGEEASLTSWESVRWKELAVDLDQRSVALAKLSIDNYIGRIHIRKDGSINAQNLWAEELDKQAQEAQGQTGEDGQVAGAGAAAPVGEDAVGAEATQTEQAGTATTGETGEPGQPETSEPTGESPWSVSIPAIQITDSQIDFMDESLPIVFRTVIGGINGDITGLDSAADAEARVDIKGSVDNYAPVALSGTAQPLSEPPAIDLLLTFDGIDLAMLSPYSATYAGYRIDRGLLDLDLQYALKDHRLAGNNKVLIDKMKLGEKVESEKAADVPLELAITLLTDINGVIDLEVPVSGNLDDPEFSLGSVIWGAFLNLITKAVTAPFNLLASLVGSEEDLQRVNFASGSAELDQAGRNRLDQLGQALSQRPQLSLVVSGRLQPEADRESLQKNILQAELVAAGLSPEQLDSKGPDWEQAIVERYQRLTPGATGLTVREQAQQLTAAIPLPDDAMANLAQQRAAAVKAYLVNEVGLDPGRAVIEQTRPEDPDNRYSGVELAIDT